MRQLIETIARFWPGLPAFWPSDRDSLNVADQRSGGLHDGRDHGHRGMAVKPGGGRCRHVTEYRDDVELFFQAETHGIFPCNSWNN